MEIFEYIWVSVINGIPRASGGVYVQHTQAEVVQLIMEKLRETAAHYVGDEVDAAVLTAPAWWSKEQKALLVKVHLMYMIALRQCRGL